MSKHSGTRDPGGATPAPPTAGRAARKAGVKPAHMTGVHRMRLVLFYSVRVVAYGLALSTLAGLGSLAFGALGVTGAGASSSLSEANGSVTGGPVAGETADQSREDDPQADTGLRRTLRFFLVLVGLTQATAGHGLGVGLAAFLHSGEYPFYENAGLTAIHRVIYSWSVSLLPAVVLVLAGLAVG